MTFAWICNTIGLFINTIAAGMMFRYPMSVPSYNQDGSLNISMCTHPDDFTREYKIHDFCSKLALILLIIGFSLEFLGSFFANMVEIEKAGDNAPPLFDKPMHRITLIS